MPMSMSMSMSKSMLADQDDSETPRPDTPVGIGFENGIYARKYHTHRHCFTHDAEAFKSRHRQHVRHPLASGALEAAEPVDVQQGAEAQANSSPVLSRASTGWMPGGSMRANPESDLRLFARTSKRNGNQNQCNTIQNQCNRLAAVPPLVMRFQKAALRKAERSLCCGRITLESADSTLARVFSDEWDKDSNGRITRDEMSQIIRDELGLKMSETEIEVVWRFYDRDQGNSISYEELVKGIKQCMLLEQGARREQKRLLLTQKLRKGVTL